MSELLHKLTLKAGDIVVDKTTGDVGLLLFRYDVLHDIYEDDEVKIWAWDILWSGPATDATNRRSPYTESGLINLIVAGVFMHYAT
jgi:hypothetical protein